MKRIWNKIGRNVKSGVFQKKAVEHVEKVEQGKAKVNAPRYPSEEKRQKTEKSAQMMKDLETKHEELIENMNKMTIKSTDPVERWTSVKDLPTRESEWMHRNDPIWEYGFYEPPVDKIPKNKLMFREALEVLRAKQELLDDTNSPASAARRNKASEVLGAHSATLRVESELLDDIYDYFRPFERKDKQKVVNKHELQALQDHLQGYSDQQRLIDSTNDIKKILTKNQIAMEEYQHLEAGQKEKFREAVAQLREEEHQRLNKRLAEIEQIEKSFSEATKKNKKIQENNK